MKSASRLLPLLRSKDQGDILAWIFLHPDTPHSISELARITGVHRLTVQREVDNLANAGLLLEHVEGRSRLVQPNLDNPVTAPLAELLAVSYGPIPVVNDELIPIEGVEEVWIYGSWAARHSGIPGRHPDDIDVLVVGNADRDELHDAAERASQRLGREVNITRVRREEWDRGTSGFVQTVKSRPMVQVIGGEPQ